MLWKSGTEFGTLDELNLQSKTIAIVKDAAHKASETLLQQVCYAKGRSPPWWWLTRSRLLLLALIAAMLGSRSQTDRFGSRDGGSTSTSTKSDADHAEADQRLLEQVKLARQDIGEISSLFGHWDLNDADSS